MQLDLKGKIKLIIFSICKANFSTDFVYIWLLKLLNEKQFMGILNIFYEFNICIYFYNIYNILYLNSPLYCLVCNERIANYPVSSRLIETTIKRNYYLCKFLFLLYLRVKTVHLIYFIETINL